MCAFAVTAERTMVGCGGRSGRSGRCGGLRGSGCAGPAGSARSCCRSFDRPSMFALTFPVSVGPGVPGCTFDLRVQLALLACGQGAWHRAADRCVRSSGRREKERASRLDESRSPLASRPSPPCGRRSRCDVRSEIDSPSQRMRYRGRRLSSGCAATLDSGRSASRIAHRSVL